MELKDVIHFYLGAGFWYGGFSPVRYTIKGGRHTKSHADGYTVYVISEDEQEDAFPLDENGKIELRPLNDISYEECKRIAQLALADERDFPIKVVRAKEECEVVYIKCFAGKSKTQITDTIEIDAGFNVSDKHGHFCHMTRIVAYLLLKHFDLFGLIESKQAIDKTKLQP